MPTYKVTCYVEAKSEDEAKQIISPRDDVYAERHYTDTEHEAYVNECNENGEVACIDPAHHVWAVSDEDENYCYCEKCGCVEY